jgi:ABC-type dipeptide/oligopeptide/nickel transport system permease subunit
MLANGKAPPSPLSKVAERRFEMRSRLGEVARDLLRSRGVMIGGTLFLVLMVIAIAAPVIVPYNPIEQDYGQTLRPPSREHLMGTDNFGRDIFSRVVYGAQISLQVGLISVGIASVIGIPLGLHWEQNRVRVIAHGTDQCVVKIADRLRERPHHHIAHFIDADLK